MKYIFYLLPCLLNVVMGLFFFITAKRMADADLSSLAVTATLPMWALIYAASSFIIGKYANKNNAVKILFVSQVILLSSMLGLLFIPSVKLQYFWLLASGLGTGLFFTPFQTVVKLFEKVELSQETFSRSAAIYTFSWSFGQGVGPLLAALIWGLFDPENGWKYCYMINIAIVIAVLLTLCLMRKFINKRLAETMDAVNTDKSDATQLPVLPDIMKSVWILAVGGYLALAALRTYLPDYATKCMNLPTYSQGMMLALLSIVQAFTALTCFKVRKFPFNPLSGLASGFCAILALGILSFCSGSVSAWTAAMIFGIFSGVFCFNMTYHALANYTKSARYAAGNETLVGATSVLAPLAAGVLADATSARMPFYVLTTILLVTALIFCIRTWQYRKF